MIEARSASPGPLSEAKTPSRPGVRSGVSPALEQAAEDAAHQFAA